MEKKISSLEICLQILVRGFFALWFHFFAECSGIAGIFGDNSRRGWQTLQGLTMKTIQLRPKSRLRNVFQKRLMSGIRLIMESPVQFEKWEHFQLFFYSSLNWPNFKFELYVSTVVSTAVWWPTQWANNSPLLCLSGHLNFLGAWLLYESLCLSVCMSVCHTFFESLIFYYLYI